VNVPVALCACERPAVGRREVHVLQPHADPMDYEVFWCRVCDCMIPGPNILASVMQDVAELRGLVDDLLRRRPRGPEDERDRPVSGRAPLEPVRSPDRGPEPEAPAE